MNKKIIIAGLVSSIAMAMMEMVYEGLFGVGFWSAPVFISATILRDLQTVALPVVFTLLPVILGMMGHMMNSVVLSFLFVALLGRSLHSPFSGIVVGALYALVIFFAMWFAILPIINPVMLHLNPVVFALSHMMWGAVLGAMVARRSSQ
jgi:hypothetical protein